MKLHDKLNTIGAARLAGMRRGIEKESLRIDADGALAATPHPQALGAALTHERITTDFSEAQLELITGAHLSANACAMELTQIHQHVARTLGPERLWVASMPCCLPADETIPIGRYGTSNIGRAKSVYRMGLGHRYGRRMQTISGIHYNWSLPGLSNEEHFALIRNFRRHSFLLLYLFGASPAVCASFVDGRQHELQYLARDTLHLPHATSLRMGRLGYQSDAQAALGVSCNNLLDYAASLHGALVRPFPPYERLGLLNLGGEYNQLATSLLQIENEFYSTIRPKRTIRPGERPLHALRERGVEYIEVRCMDLDPFVPTGIAASTMRVLDMFLLQCLLLPSPPDTPDEIARLADNQHLTAARGREPGLRLDRAGAQVPLVEWAAELLAGLAPAAAMLDGLQGGNAYAEALALAQQRLEQPAALPSARVLDVMARDFAHSHTGFVQAQSDAAREFLLQLPFTPEQALGFAAEAQRALARQREIEATDTLPFEAWRQQYLDPVHLMPAAS